MPDQARNLLTTLPNGAVWVGGYAVGVLAEDIPADVLLSEFVPLYHGQLLRIIIRYIGLGSSLSEIGAQDDSSLKSSVSPSIPVVFDLLVNGDYIATYTRYVGFNIAVIASTRKQYLSAGVTN